MTAHALDVFDDTTSPHVTPEQRLAMAVIVAAVGDAAARKSVNESATSRALNQKAALAWFRDGDADFREICHLAGLEPDAVQRAVLAYLGSGKRPPRRGGSLAGRKAGVPNLPYSISAIADRAAVSPQSVRNVMAGNGRASRAMSRHVTAVINEMGVAA